MWRIAPLPVNPTADIRTERTLKDVLKKPLERHMKHSFLAFFSVNKQKNLYSHKISTIVKNTNCMQKPTHPRYKNNRYLSHNKICLLLTKYAP
ncbi:hypothetical protein D0C16_00615 [Cellvibrio sp. KY-GH-1]|nr:hypothetical protein D0C16_00615 [Cellvibrio sp. KY-GH-1]